MWTKSLILTSLLVALLVLTCSCEEPQVAAATLTRTIVFLLSTKVVDEIEIDSG